MGLTEDETCAREVWKNRTHRVGSIRARSRLVHQFLNMKDAPSWIKDFAVCQWPVDDQDCKKKFLQAKSVLLTWQGDWGVVRKLTSGEPFASDLHLLEEQLRQEPPVLALYAELKKRVADMQVRLDPHHFALSVELCTGTWQAEKVVRVHSHAFFMNSLKKMVTQTLLPLTFLGSLPNKSACDAPHHRGKNVYCGIYYATARKYGNLLSFSSAVAWEHFPVQCDWALGLLELGKMSFENVRDDICRSPKSLMRKLGDLDRWQEEKKIRDRRARIEARQAQLQRVQRPFKDHPQVNAFLRKYNGPKPCERKRIMVLTGPSGMGKTQYVRSLFPSGSLLGLNAANMKTPCLPVLDEDIHKAIFWDECPAFLVSENRKLFQHTATLIDLGHSPTGQHIKRVWLNDAVSIIATNRWEEDVAALPAESDAAWLRVNTIVIRVTSPLFG